MKIQNLILLVLLFTTLFNIQCQKQSVQNLKYELLPYEPVADDSQIVISSNGHARFTILTNNLIRMEYSKHKFKFEDRPSIAFLNRRTKQNIKIQSQEMFNTLTITTPEFILIYKLGLNFNEKGSLRVIGTNPSSSFSGWEAGLDSSTDEGNLLGTYRTLDQIDNPTLNCTVNNQPHCEFGIISKSGWALVNDTDTPVLDQDDWWTNEHGKLYKRRSSLDLYLFTHGRNYRQALKDFTLVGGKIPLLPKYSLGIWFTRWYNLNQQNVNQYVEEFESRNIPLDVFILDMNWHTKDDWTGYSFDRNLYQNPKQMFDYLKIKKGLRVGANIHDADGINYWEDVYEEACQIMGVNPSSQQRLNFSLVDKKYWLSVVEDLALKKVEDLGMDFWWIDWQQGEAGQGGVSGFKMNPTIWTDKTRVTDHKRRGSNLRGFTFARFGGLGNHRYQIGFSGDVRDITWANLAYQPYFTMTASNVGYGFWSHDIVGPGDDHELYVRWLQWGAYSGIMRHHDRGGSAGSCKDPFPTADYDEFRCWVVEPYNVPQKYFKANRQALQERARLIPYLYTETRIAHDNGVSLIYPLYYDYPYDEMAYACNLTGEFSQYMYGSKIMVAPIVQQSDSTSMSQKTIYIPEGLWFEKSSGRLYQGPQNITKYYDLTEIPVFIKSGSIITEIPLEKGFTGNAQKQYNSLVFNVFPNENQGSAKVYEDDGITTDYLNSSNYAFIKVNYQRVGSQFIFTIQTEGNYSKQPKQRNYRLKIFNSMPAKQIRINGAPIQFDELEMSSKYWSYDGENLALNVQTDHFSTHQKVTIEIQLEQITYGDFSTFQILNGLAGQFKHANLAKNNFDEVRLTPGSDTTNDIRGSLNKASSTSMELSYLAGNDISVFKEKLNSFATLYNNAVREVKTFQNQINYQLTRLNSYNQFTIDSNRYLYGITLLCTATYSPHDYCQ